MDKYRLARIAYDAYCKARDWKSVRGEPLPHFDQQSEELKVAWAVAAKAVSDDIALVTGRG